MSRLTHTTPSSASTRRRTRTRVTVGTRTTWRVMNSESPTSWPRLACLNSRSPSATCRGSARARGGFRRRILGDGGIRQPRLLRAAVDMLGRPEHKQSPSTGILAITLALGVWPREHLPLGERSRRVPALLGVPQVGLVSRSKKHPFHDWLAEEKLRASTQGRLSGRRHQIWRGQRWRRGAPRRLAHGPKRLRSHPSCVGAGTAAPAPRLAGGVAVGVANVRHHDRPSALDARLFGGPRLKAEIASNARRAVGAGRCGPWTRGQDTRIVLRISRRAASSRLRLLHAAAALALRCARARKATAARPAPGR